LAAPLTILVGALWVVSSIGDLAFQSGLATDEGFLVVVLIPFFLSVVPMLFALIGTRLRFHQSAGVPGRLGLALSVAGCAGVIVFLLAHLLLSGVAPAVAQLNYAAVGCVLSIRIGYILLGVD